MRFIMLAKYSLVACRTMIEWLRRSLWCFAHETMRLRWPLRYQIMLPMVGILLLTIAVVSALNAWLASARARRQLEDQLADVSRTLATSNFPLESNVLRQMRGLTSADYVLVDGSGHAVAASDDALIFTAEKTRAAESRAGLSAIRGP